MLLLSGSLHSVLTAIFLILEKVARDSAAGKTGRAQAGAKAREEREDEVGASAPRGCLGMARCTRLRLPLPRTPDARLPAPTCDPHCLHSLALRR